MVKFPTIGNDKAQQHSKIVREIILKNQQLAILLGLLVIILFFSILSPAFLKLNNVENLIRIGSINGVLALGMMLVIIVGGIDLSVGSTLALGGAISAGLMKAIYTNASIQVGFPVSISIFIALLVGGTIGLINGSLISKLSLEPFAVTLGMMSLVRGITYIFTDFIVKGVPGTSITFYNPHFEWLAGGNIGISPVPAIIFAFLVVFLNYLLKHTLWGRNLYVVGGDLKVAYLTGINTEIISISAFALSGVLAALTGVLFTGRLACASPLIGQGYEFDAITAVVLGGTSLSGGQGGVIQTIVGVLFITVLSNGLDLLNVGSFYQYLVKGVVLVVAVALDQKRQRAIRQQYI